MLKDKLGDHNALLPSEEPRVYFLPISSDCIPGCPFCEWVGCRNPFDRGVGDVERAIHRAKEAGFHEVLFSSSLLNHPRRHEFVNLCRQAGLKVGLQLAWELRSSFKFPIDIELDGIEYLFSGSEKISPQEQREAGVPRHRVSERSVRYSLVLTVDVDPINFLAQFSTENLKVLHVFVPPYRAAEKGKPRTLTVAEAAAVLSRIKRVYPKLELRPPYGREVWEPEVPSDLCLEPNTKPEVDWNIAGSTPEITVILPSYNNGALLKNALRHLLAQNLPRERFEIVVVDDGSSDDTVESIRKFMAPESGRCNFRHIKFGRARPRLPGVADFRAGIARNLGVKQARGHFVSFLDSDIIVPGNYLERILEELKTCDVLQTIRYHLKPYIESAYIDYQEIRPGKDTFVLEDEYWGAFFKVPDWQSLPMHWKYTCTYSLSLKRELFCRVGWIRRTFVFYGFEDTDLGYRLARAGARFRLGNIVTYHLSSEKERRRGFDSPFVRHRLLARTAKIFWRNTLDLSVYDHFRSFMDDERTWFASIRERFGFLRFKAQ